MDFNYDPRRDPHEIVNVLNSWYARRSIAALILYLSGLALVIASSAVFEYAGLSGTYAFLTECILVLLIIYSWGVAHIHRLKVYFYHCADSLTRTYCRRDNREEEYEIMVDMFREKGLKKEKKRIFTLLSIMTILMAIFTVHMIVGTFNFPLYSFAVFIALNSVGYSIVNLDLWKNVFVKVMQPLTIFDLKGKF